MADENKKAAAADEKRRTLNGNKAILLVVKGDAEFLACTQDPTIAMKAMSDNQGARFVEVMPQFKS